ncbi:helix-turn-helix domain-containing protein [Planotetraspora sp. GP83]|uniref:helix-turn-helix domain-containing protein n=1 Tax=Planotetraspora sp. GP83 TaxID=3156264 RepID=UPI00351746E6
MSETWTIGELAERAAALLGSEPRVNGRVREVPNERLIRWYTTIGLVDPPLTRRGRVALYGRRHLLQLLAIKRRQADGLSIAAIQTELAGATDSMLQRAAGLSAMAPDAAVPADADMPKNTPVGSTPFGTVTPDSPSEQEGTATRKAEVARGRAVMPDGHTTQADGVAPASRQRFWTRPAPPAAPVPAPESMAEGAFATTREAASVGTATGEPLPVATVAAADTGLPTDVVYGVRLAPGVTVMLDLAGRTPTADDIAALRRASEPLLATLAGLHLTRDSKTPRTRGNTRSDHAEGMTP